MVTNYLSTDDFPEQEEEIIFKSDAQFRRDLKEVAESRKEQKRLIRLWLNCVKFHSMKKPIKPSPTKREKTTAQIDRGFAIANKWKAEQEQKDMANAFFKVINSGSFRFKELASALADTIDVIKNLGKEL